MKKSAQLQTKAWLLKGVSSIPGTLRLAGGRLTFTAFGSGNFWGGQLRKLEENTGQVGLAQQLENGKNVVVFDVPLSEVRKINFPWYYFSGGVKLTINGVHYRFGFDKPANTKLSGEGGDVVGEISRARRSGKAWQAVLANNQLNYFILLG